MSQHNVKKFLEEIADDPDKIKRFQGNGRTKLVEDSTDLNDKEKLILKGKDDVLTWYALMGKEGGPGG